MRAARCVARLWAFSLIELLCVIAIIGILAALLLPAISRAKTRATRLQCLNHLHEAGVAFQSFAHDHNGQFPMSVPGSAGGSMEFVQNASLITGPYYFGFRHFQALSNELVTPKVVICPADTREVGTNFATLKNENVSYFVGVNSEAGQATSVLAGDRNITNDYAGLTSTLQLGANYGLRWTRELHEFKGNLLFADGHVEEKSTPGLNAAGNQVPPVAVLAVPTDTPPGMGPAETGSRVNGSAMIPPAVLGIGQKAAGSAGGNAAPAAAPGQPGAMVAMSSSGRGSSSMAGAAVAPSDQPATSPKRPSTPTNSAATGPTRTASDEDQQPTFFGQWVASLMEGLVRKGLWWLYALLVLMIGATLVARRWARGKRVKPAKMSPPED